MNKVRLSTSKNRKSHACHFLMMGFLAVSLVSTAAWLRTKQDLRNERERVSSLSSDVKELRAKNKNLQEYAEDARSFALGIRPLFDENDSGCEDPNCAACRKMEKENDRKLDEFSKAMNTLNIDYEKLARLQEGLEQ